MTKGSGLQKERFIWKIWNSREDHLDLVRLRPALLQLVVQSHLHLIHARNAGKSSRSTTRTAYPKPRCRPSRPRRSRMHVWPQRTS